LEAFKKAHKSSSNSAALWSNIGIAMVQKNKLVAAYCCLKRALFLDPFRWDLHANLALIFMRKGK
jgi:Bardet-Biedl syndrome 4 protein